MIDIIVREQDSIMNRTLGKKWKDEATKLHRWNVNSGMLECCQQARWQTTTTPDVPTTRLLGVLGTTLQVTSKRCLKII